MTQIKKEVTATAIFFDFGILIPTPNLTCLKSAF